MFKKMKKWTSKIEKLEYRVQNLSDTINNPYIGEFYSKEYNQNYGKHYWDWLSFKKNDVEDQIDGFTKIKYYYSRWIENKNIVYYEDTTRIEKLKRKVENATKKA